MTSSPPTAGGPAGPHPGIHTDAEGDVVLEVPAAPAFLTVVRAAVAAAVARMGATVDDVDDVRLAVSEAGTVLIEKATDAATLHVLLSCRESTVRLRMTSATRDENLPTDTFAWTVLTALVASAACRLERRDDAAFLVIDIELPVQIPA